MSRSDSRDLVRLFSRPRNGDGSKFGSATVAWGAAENGTPESSGEAREEGNAPNAVLAAWKNWQFTPALLVSAAAAPATP